MQKEFEDAVFSFVRRVSGFDFVSSVILFGSVAKGDADRRSDIDFLVIFDTASPVKKDETKAVGTLALDIEKEFDRSVQLVFSNKNFDGLDGQFVEDVFRSGMILYGKNPQVDIKKLKLEPYSIVYFSLKNISRPEKMKLGKALYGHSTTKKYKDKIYKSAMAGLIEQFGGKRTGMASVLVPSKRADELAAVLKGFGAKYEVLDVWISRA